jgi:hypothetical protein
MSYFDGVLGCLRITEVKSISYTSNESNYLKMMHKIEITVKDKLKTLFGPWLLKYGHKRVLFLFLFVNSCGLNEMMYFSSLIRVGKSYLGTNFSKAYYKGLLRRQLFILVHEYTSLVINLLGKE